MHALIVVDQPKDWPFDIPDVQVISAREYLTSSEHSERRGVRVFNLCRSYKYQRAGYYVSLLAGARGHRPIPSIETLSEFRHQARVQVFYEELEDEIQRCLKPLVSDEFTLSIYFGRNTAARYSALSRRLFNLVPAPFLRAFFQRNEDGRILRRLEPIDASAIPAEHQSFVVEAANEYFSGRTRRSARPKSGRYDLAILHAPEEEERPSNDVAMRRFVRAAEKAGFDVDMVTREDYAHIAEYDALFIRATTAVNHYTFRFAQRAAALGLVVIDDPESILRCTNKVYLAELLRRHRIPHPRTLLLHRRNVDEVAGALGLPCVLKQPDSAFSKGVKKVDTEQELKQVAGELLDDSELIVAQEFLPTDFDWRIGVCAGEPLYVCRYYMARQHWQIVKRDAAGNKADEGYYDTLRVEDAPPQVVETALKAASLIGRGLYGVDLKEVNGKCYIIEINDNPSIDGGVEDKLAKDTIYATIMNTLMQRVESKKRVPNQDSIA